MKSEAWPRYSFTEWLRPPDGWRTDRAILSTYSAELFTVLTALVALAGGNRDERNKLGRVEVIKAMEALKGKVRVLAQSGRVTAANKTPAALKLMDRFVKMIPSDEMRGSWHPKAALVCHQNINDPDERQWGFWIGSWNLTAALNWDAGVGVASAPHPKGRPIEGLSEAAATLADHAALPGLDAATIRRHLSRQRWEAPPGCEVHRIYFRGPGLAAGLPETAQDARCVRVISPFVDTKTLRTVAGWGRPNSVVVVSTAPELARVEEEDDALLKQLDPRIQPIPDLPAETAEPSHEEVALAVEPAEAEEPPPPGLHAKLYYVEKGSDRRLWIGSANATERAWKGRNYEIVSEMTISREVANNLKAFVDGCAGFRFGIKRPPDDEDEMSLERARKLLTGCWPLRQRIGETEWAIVADAPPPLNDPAIELSVSALGGSWAHWPFESERLILPAIPVRHRSDFLRIRIARGKRACIWVQAAPCDPPPDEERDQALIAQCLDANIFMEWVRSELAGEPARGVGGDFDDAPDGQAASTHNPHDAQLPAVPTVEEILRSWARDPYAFAQVDKNVSRYLGELERRALEQNVEADLALLTGFRECWTKLASSLR